MTENLASGLTKTGLRLTATTADTGAGSLTAQAAKILVGRGISLELVNRLGWNSSKKTTVGDPIEIPYFLGGEHVNSKFRTLSGEKKFFQKKEGVKCFYNADCIPEWQAADNERLVITEGEMDCVIALQCGFFAVSVPDGAPSARVGADGSKYSYLDGFPRNGEIILAVDGDSAGTNLLYDLGARLGRHRCRWVKYPKGCKDLNDVQMQFGQEAVIELLGNSEWLKVEGIYRMGELPPLPEQEGKRLDIFPISIRKGDFSVWSGIPSHGKTTLTNFVAFELAKSGWNIAHASFEQTPQTEHRYNLRTLALGYGADHAAFDELDHVDKWIDEKYTFLIPDQDSDEDATLGWLMDKMVAAVTRNAVDMFIIDPWNEMEHSFDKRNMSQTDYTGFAIKELKRFAKKHLVHVAVVAHPTKMPRKSKTHDGVPSLYDIADSAHWANKADLGVIVHRDEDGSTLVKVQKSRYHHQIGKPGNYNLTYDDGTKVFSKKIKTEVDAIFSQYQ